jgi:hypothetical protein
MPERQAACFAARAALTALPDFAGLLPLPHASLGSPHGAMPSLTCEHGAAFIAALVCCSDACCMTIAASTATRRYCPPACGCALGRVHQARVTAACCAACWSVVDAIVSLALLPEAALLEWLLHGRQRQRRAVSLGCLLLMPSWLVLQLPIC